MQVCVIIAVLWRWNIKVSLDQGQLCIQLYLVAGAKGRVHPTWITCNLQVHVKCISGTAFNTCHNTVLNGKLMKNWPTTRLVCMLFQLASNNIDLLCRGLTANAFLHVKVFRTVGSISLRSEYPCWQGKPAAALPGEYFHSAVCPPPVLLYFLVATFIFKFCLLATTGAYQRYFCQCSRGLTSRLEVSEQSCRGSDLLSTSAHRQALSADKPVWVLADDQLTANRHHSELCV